MFYCKQLPADELRRTEQSKVCCTYEVTCSSSMQAQGRLQYYEDHTVLRERCNLLMKTIVCSESDATCLHCVVVSANHFVASASCSHVHCRSIEAATLHRLPVACIYSTNSLRIGSTHILMLWNSPPTPRTPEQISFHELKAAPPQPGFRLRSSMRRAFRETGFTRCCGARVRTAGSSIPGTHFVAVHNYVLFSRHASAWTVLPCS